MTVRQGRFIRSGCAGECFAFCAWTALIVRLRIRLKTWIFLVFGCYQSSSSKDAGNSA